jgi:hypothetical protein
MIMIVHMASLLMYFKRPMSELLLHSYSSLFAFMCYFFVVYAFLIKINSEDRWFKLIQRSGPTAFS